LDIENKNAFSFYKNKNLKAEKELRYFGLLYFTITVLISPEAEEFQ